MTKKKNLPPVFSGEIFENGWVWTAAFEQSKIAACNVIRFLTIKILSAFFYNVTLNIEYLKIATSETTSEITSLQNKRDHEVLRDSHPMNFNNLIKQNQKLGSDSVLKQNQNKV